MEDPGHALAAGRRTDSSCHPGDDLWSPAPFNFMWNIVLIFVTIIRTDILRVLNIYLY